MRPPATSTIYTFFYYKQPQKLNNQAEIAEKLNNLLNNPLSLKLGIEKCVTWIILLKFINGEAIMGKWGLWLVGYIIWYNISTVYYAWIIKWDKLAKTCYFLLFWPLSYKQPPKQLLRLKLSKMLNNSSLDPKLGVVYI